MSLARRPGREELERLAGLLSRAYDVPAVAPSKEPLDELVATILSQHTSDRNSHRAFFELKRRFPRWSETLAAGPGPVAEAIRGGGLAPQKAPRIIELLGDLPKDAAGEPTLGHLEGMEVAEAYDYLLGLPGVGPKTAACTLLFAYGWPAFPVDTHVCRVARRLGWAGEKDTAEKVQRVLMEAVPPELTLTLHLGLVLHGRRVCRPRAPRCESCPVREMCAAGRA